MSSPSLEPDSLSNLEERIRRTVEMVSTLRSEIEAAREERDQAQKSAAAAVSENQKLRQEIDELRGERKQVRTRIEKLLGQMDLLSGT